MSSKVAVPCMNTTWIVEPECCYPCFGWGGQKERLNIQLELISNVSFVQAAPNAYPRFIRNTCAKLEVNLTNHSVLVGFKKRITLNLQKTSNYIYQKNKYGWLLEFWVSSWFPVLFYRFFPTRSDFASHVLCFLAIWPALISSTCVLLNCPSLSL